MTSLLSLLPRVPLTPFAMPICEPVLPLVVLILAYHPLLTGMLRHTVNISNTCLISWRCLNTPNFGFGDGCKADFKWVPQITDTVKLTGVLGGQCSVSLCCCPFVKFPCECEHGCCSCSLASIADSKLSRQTSCCCLLVHRPFSSVSFLAS